MSVLHLYTIYVQIAESFRIQVHQLLDFKTVKGKIEVKIKIEPVQQYPSFS